MDRTALLQRVVDVARMAPSVHNTQPWVWRMTGKNDGTTLELWADRERILPVCDPLGRNLVLSCGCAVHYASVAAEALGLEVKVDQLPEGSESDLMARFELAPSQPRAEAQERLAPLLARHTDRRRFTSWPVPADRLDRLAEAGRPWGAAVLPVTEAGLRKQVEELIDDSRRHQLADPRIADETESWIDHSPSDGIPSTVLPHLEGARGERATRFGSGLVPDSDERVLEGTDRLLVVSTEDDGPLSWLRAGAALSALWLQATADGLSVVPLSQLIEVERTRVGLEKLLPPPARAPQVLARVGWQQIGRGDLPRTPRRPLVEVLRRS